MANAVNSILNKAALLQGIAKSHNDEHPSIGDTVNELWQAEDDFVKEIVDHQAELADPQVRAELNGELGAMKTGLTEVLDGLTEEDLPKSVEDMQMIFLSAVAGGMVVGDFKTAMALIPESPTPPTPEPAPEPPPSQTK